MIDMDQHTSRFQLPRWVHAIAPRPFDWVQLFLYLAVLINFIVVSCTCDFSWWRIGGLSATMVTLLALDRWEHWRYNGVIAIRTAVLLFLARVALVEVAAQIDRFDISSFLYVLLPFTATIAFGISAGWWIGALIWLRYVLELTNYGANWPLVQTNNNGLILFSLGIIFVLTMAKLVIQEQANRARTEKLLAELEQSHEQLTVYAAQVADLATASERNRLARDIHDSLGHYLTVINVQLEKALAFRSKDARVADRAVEDSKRLAREALDDVRRSVGMLRASQQVFSLHDALQTLVERTRSEQLQVTLSFSGDESDMSPQALMALYRVAQEGLTNVQRHAQAKHVAIAVDLNAHEAQLSLVDDGVGFDADFPQHRDAANPGGYGLRGVQERLELVAGSLQIATRPDQGTQLIAVVPRSQLQHTWPALMPQGSQL